MQVPISKLKGTFKNPWCVQSFIAGKLYDVSAFHFTLSYSTFSWPGYTYKLQRASLSSFLSLSKILKQSFKTACMLLYMHRKH